MPWEYSQKVLQLFMDAVRGEPGTHMGKVENPDGFGEHGSIVCGDALRFSFRVRKDPQDPTRDVITEARYLTFGCTSAIASSEALCSLLEEGEKTPIEALKVSNQDLVDYLGGLPKQKIHCSVMGAEALQAAVADWARKRGVDLSPYLPIPTEQEEGELVCKCFSLTRPYLLRKIRELGLHTLEEITGSLKAGGACGECRYKPGGLQDLLHECWGDEPAHLAGEAPKPEPDQISPYRMGKEIDKAIQEVILPLLQTEGGTMELIDIKENLVYCRLGGSGADRPEERRRLTLLVEGQLKEMVDDRLKVIPV